MSTRRNNCSRFVIPKRTGLVLALFGAFLGAQTGPPPGAPGMRPPGPPPVLMTIHRDIEYTNGLKLDLYVRSGAKEPAPVVIWLESKRKFPTPAARLVADGYAVASVEFGSGQLNDCKAAVQWLHTNASQYMLDAEHVGVWGADEGGRMAALVGMEGSVQAVVDYYGSTGEVHPDGSQHLPPFLVVHGTADTTVSPRQSELFISVLKVAGADASIEYVAGAHHTLAEVETPTIEDTVTNFFDKALRAGKHERGDVDAMTIPPDCWEDPIVDEVPGTQYKTYPTPSRGLKTQASYRLYLPPDYETNKSRRYPVIYYLHGMNDNSRKAIAAGYIPRLDFAIRTGLMPAAIVIVPQGLNKGWYVNSKDGKNPMESVIVKDLIAHVDSTYRTIPKREARAIEGHSMGGFGALHLGFKYPEVFGTVASISAALVDLTAATSGMNYDMLQVTFGGDAEYFKEENPATLAKKNVDKIRGHTLVRMMVGDKDGLAAPNHAFDEMLTKLDIPHQFYLSKGAPHSIKEVLARLDFDPFEFYTKAFAEPSIAYLKTK